MRLANYNNENPVVFICSYIFRKKIENIWLRENLHKAIFMLVMRLSFVTNRDFLDVDLFSTAHESDLDSTMQLGIFDDRTAFNYLTRSHYPLCYKKVLLKNNTGNQMIF